MMMMMMMMMNFDDVDDDDDEFDYYIAQIFEYSGTEIVFNALWIFELVYLVTQNGYDVF